MSDYGAEISQQGIDIKNASDDQKVLDTRWVTLDIASETLFTFDGLLPTGASGGSFGFTNTAIIAYTHNLGFLPAFEHKVLTISSDGNLGFDPVDMWADEKNIYFVPNILSSAANVSVSVTIKIRIYNLPITEYYRAPVVQGDPVTTNTPSDYGIRFLSQDHIGANIATADVEDFAFSSGLRPLNVLQHGITTVPDSGYQISINYDYSNPPLYLVGIYQPTSLPGNGYLSPVLIPSPVVGSLSFSGSRGTITPDTISISGAQAGLSGSYVYILFKDPINIKT